MADHFEVIVVGAGPAGNAAALTLAKAGLDVLQLERAEFPGAKTGHGSLLWAPALEQLVPDFRTRAPLERYIIEQYVWTLDEAAHTGSRDWTCASASASDRYTILRAPFDAWFSSALKAAGVRVCFATTVIEVIHEKDGPVIGVRTARDGEFYAGVVILAEGVEGLVARQSGLGEDVHPQGVALTVKELRRLPRHLLENRFNVHGDDGVIFEAAGTFAAGVSGRGFIYTNRESLSVGVGCLIDDIVESELTPSELLACFKRHPSIRPLLAESEVIDFSALLSPEGGYRVRPKLFGDGWLACGDAMQPGSPMFREGATLALTSGRLAAETVIEVTRHGRPMSARHLSLYRDKLERSPILSALRRLGNAARSFGEDSTLPGADPRRLGRGSRALSRDPQDGEGRQRKLLRYFTRGRSRSLQIGGAA
jgi:electron transfer flavoprotein-quinone oxidoreductase